MIRFKKYFYLLSNTLICLYILILLKSHQNHLLLFINGVHSSSVIVYQNFTCQTWTNFSYINPSKYHECLKWKPGKTFWRVHGLRHTAHKSFINSSSLIIEVGANRGDDTLQFIRLYNSSIICYEPLPSMVKNLRKMLGSNTKIDVQPYGLASRARNISVELNDVDNVGTSIFRNVSTTNASNIQQIELLDVVQVIQHIRKTRTKTGIIDMISINCEGCEFEILPALIVNNMTQYIRIIQFATHISLLSNSSCIYCQIEQGLERTHNILYHHRMVWEAWVRKHNTNG